MIVIRVWLDVAPEHLVAFREHAVAEGVASRTLDGCEAYGFHEGLGTPGRVLLYEEWTDFAAFERYKASAAFADNAKKLMPMLAGKPDSAYYDGRRFEAPG